MKRFVLSLLLWGLLWSPASAEIVQRVDKYSNYFTIASTTLVQLPRSAEMTVRVEKGYSTVKKAPPNVSLDFLVIAPEYWFFNDSIEYLIQGDPVGKRDFLKTWNTFPQPGLVGCMGLRVLYSNSPIVAAIMEGKSITFRLSFKKQGFYEYTPTPEVLAEWKQIILFTPPQK